METGGTVDCIYDVVLSNASQRMITVTVEPDVGQDWKVFPDHQHVEIKAGESAEMRFRFQHEADLAALTVPAFRSTVDYHGQDLRIAVGEQTTTVEVSIDMPSRICKCCS
jgi:hypothetical protein